MRLFTLFIALFIFAGSGSAEARVPRCGDIERSDIKNVYKDAEKIRLKNNKVSDHIDEFCDTLDDLRRWEKQQLKNGKNFSVDYKKAKVNVVLSAKRNILDMKDPLILIRVMSKLNPDSDVEKALRRQQIREAQEKLEKNINALKIVTARAMAMKGGS